MTLKKNNSRHNLIPGCWASSHGSCDGELTKEHVVSRSILNLFKPIKYRFDNRPPAVLGKGSFVIKKLCKKHNELLSPYDAEAYKLFSHTSSIFSQKLDTQPKHFANGIHKLHISRKKIERWYAKTFFNYVLFMTALSKPEKLPFMLNACSIVDKLYSDNEFTSPFGLYLIDPNKRIMKNNTPFHIQAVTNKESNLIKSDGKISDKYMYPQFLYTRVLGIEVVGVFNITSLNDNDAIKILDSEINVLRKIGQQDFGGFGFSPKSQNGQDVKYEVLFDNA